MSRSRPSVTYASGCTHCFPNTCSFLQQTTALWNSPLCLTHFPSENKPVHNRTLYISWTIWRQFVTRNAMTFRNCRWSDSHILLNGIKKFSHFFRQIYAIQITPVAGTVHKNIPNNKRFRKNCRSGSNTSFVDVHEFLLVLSALLSNFGKMRHKRSWKKFCCWVSVVNFASISRVNAVPSLWESHLRVYRTNEWHFEIY